MLLPSLGRLSRDRADLIQKTRERFRLITQIFFFFVLETFDPRKPGGVSHVTQ